MTIDLLQRLSYKLARTSFVVVVVLGVLVASLQVYLDFRSQYQDVLENVEEISRVSRSAGQRAVFLLDDRLAEQVVDGLSEYRFLSHIAILDDQKKLMAEYRQPVTVSQTQWLTKLLVASLKPLSLPCNRVPMPQRAACA